MKVDKQGRITIPSTLKNMSSISDYKRVAFMMKERGEYYLLPEDEYKEGKLLAFCCIDNKNRITIPRNASVKDAECVFYLERGVINIQIIA